MLNQFSRTELLYGRKALERLADAKIAVFGIGGVGGYTVEALARAGIGTLELVDDDKICLTNINRQIYALRETIGRYKVDVAAERIRQINPECVVRPRKTFYSPQSAENFNFEEFDYIVDAIDTVTGKVDLAVQAQKNNVHIISAMGAGNKTNPLLFEITDIYKTSVCPLAKVMRKELKKRGIEKLKVVFSKEKPSVPIDDPANSCRSHCVCPPGTARKCTQRRQIPSSNSFIPPIVGMIIAGEIINELVEETKK
ncbi:tRNA threonylcarbamoyladenosine dehydratase [Pectinatus haikarae]|uniref:tRNA A37 threonylcarbamoyladenosine dehydratase n=1 Tax=Pectinatus haikarae TaxID=349096 RepID=A0ABT9Y4S7_9FIRM|nr:tRNA threonylcarbamoyladenosine dehydratase [Pectinatus haikarae]MDQ0202749.1 tRNA A37 threonylcarbamoyladenosine dehydratase [Pectinatus haikarae]